MLSEPYLYRSSKHRDYPQLTKLYKKHVPWPINQNRLKLWDKEEQDAGVFKRVVCENSKTKKIVGLASITKDPYHANQGHYTLDVLVDLNHRCYGIGSDLCKILDPYLDKLQPSSIYAYIGDQAFEAQKFVKNLGFDHIQTEGEYHCKLRKYKYTKPCFHNDYEIINFEKAEHRLNYFDKQLWKLDYDLHSQIQESDNSTQRPRYREWLRRKKFDKFTMKKNSFVVIYKPTKEIIGFTTVTRDPQPKTAMIEITGVLEQHRRKGLGKALKLICLNSLKKTSIETVRTMNDITNEPIINLNKALGFNLVNKWYTYAKKKD